MSKFIDGDFVHCFKILVPGGDFYANFVPSLVKINTIQSIHHTKYEERCVIFTGKDEAYFIEQPMEDFFTDLKKALSKGLSNVAKDSEIRRDRDWSSNMHSIKKDVFF